MANSRLITAIAIVGLSAASSPAQAPDQPAPPPGKVIFSRSLDSGTEESQPAAQPTLPPQPAAPAQSDPLAVTGAERDALTFTAYDLDVHLTPASAAISVRAGLTLRNDSAAPLARLVLQISSALHLDAISTRILPSGPTAPLPFAARLIDTDADHTGRMNEAVVTLPHPLAPGASLSLIALYSGAIPPSAERLTRIGAPDDQALAADWDSITPSLTALRGFGNVLWLPASAPPVFLGDGARLFQSVGNSRLRNSAATVRLRLAVEYTGDPPDAAFFCGLRQPLAAISDNANLPAAISPGVATATFDAQPLGFRTPSLFVTDRPPSQTGTPANPTLIDAVTDHYDALPAYAAAAALVEPLLTDWLGPNPLATLSLIDHPGQPFEDDSLLVRPMRSAEPATLAPALAHSLTHVWIHSTHPWIDEGLAQFLSVLWTERTAGRAAALTELQDAARPLALAEPEDPDSASATVSPAGTSLVSATGDIFYRTKAAAVWWMLRSIVGDDALKQALQTYRLDAARLDRDPDGLQHALEKSSHQDLRWFFDDWVYRDRGLPDLSIVSVTPSQLTSRAGLPAGWLIAVEVRNDGYAAAEVPVTVRSATASETERLRVPGRSTASIRIVFSGTPAEVQVNDGGVPETQTSLHTRQILLPSH
jgi:Peptidase family M1 domain